MTTPLLAAGDLTSDFDLSVDELRALMDLAADVKRSPSAYRSALKGRIASLLFEKPSLRTRITFEVGAKQLGGDAILHVGPIGGREPVADVARNLDRWTDVIIARTFAQQTVEDLARYSRVPVINALSDMFHPCQALADMLTIKEHLGGWTGFHMAYVGDGNNMAHSLMLASARLGLSFTCITPPAYEPNGDILARAQQFAATSGATVRATTDIEDGLRNADAVYTDVWASMGQEHEAAARARLFSPYQVNADLMSMAQPGALFMHCLPAHRDEEVTEDVIESKTSVVFDQAENRLHAQKALLLMLVDGPAR